MPSAFGQDRTPGEDVRVRRNSQSWQDDNNLVLPAGALSVDPETGALFVNIVAPLQIASNAIGIDLGNGLAVVADQLAVALAANPGLAFSSGLLLIDLDTNPGLALAAGGLGISLAANSGLTTTGGLQAVLDGSSLSLGASGLSVTDPAGRQGVSAVVTVASNAAWGETMRADPSGGTFVITAPTAVGNAGRRFTVKNVTSDTTSFTIDANGAQTVDGASDATISTAFGSLTLESDGANLMIVASA